ARDRDGGIDGADFLDRAAFVDRGEFVAWLVSAGRAVERWSGDAGLDGIFAGGFGAGGTRGTVSGGGATSAFAGGLFVALSGGASLRDVAGAVGGRAVARTVEGVAGARIGAGPDLAGACFEAFGGAGGDDCGDDFRDFDRRSGFDGNGFFVAGNG